jgi:ABC-type phosphate transport system substrate-binding protein
MTRTILSMLAVLAVSAFAQSDFAVVVNKSNPATHVTKAQLRRMVSGDMTSWPEGEKVSVLLAGPGEPARAAMLKEICGMSESDFGLFVTRKTFAGSNAMPKIQPSTTAVRQKVPLSPGAVGIIPAADVDDTVKVIPVD